MLFDWTARALRGALRGAGVVVVSGALGLGIGGQGALAQEVEVAGDLVVDLDAAAESAGTDLWLNDAPESLGDFVRIGEPTVEVVDGVTAVTFNSSGVLDVYQSEFPPFEPIVGINPTRTIEVWAYNPAIASEETMVAWGARGGPDGSNMSFNYGTHEAFGAVGHWGGPDIGWNDAGGAPAAGVWHHLVYTYDGTTTRVYADGCLVDEEQCPQNQEELGLDVINTNTTGLLNIAAQNEADGFTPNQPLAGTLSIARVRVHSEALDAEQVQSNYDLECPLYCSPENLPECENCPEDEDNTYSGKDYVRALTLVANPPLTDLRVTSPAGATISAAGVLRYVLPDPAPGSFEVAVEAENDSGTETFEWSVIVNDPPDLSPVEVAEELLVSLDAAEATAGGPVWLNAGSLADFQRLGEPLPTALGSEGSAAIEFNLGKTNDAYLCAEDAPATLVGLDPTRSIEVWTYNPTVESEETLVSWGSRGGPDGTNMSFNYGTNAVFGAVGQWGATPDLGWSDDGLFVPLAGEWHHLVYTYDGVTTRVYADGVLANSEDIGNGVINTIAGTPIALAVQHTNTTGALEFGPIEGTLAMGQVRVHAGVLSAGQVSRNSELERERYGLPEAPLSSPEFVDPPFEGAFCEGAATYTVELQITGTPPPTVTVVSPDGATIDESGVLSYAIPSPAPESFEVTVRAENPIDTVEQTWDVVRIDALDELVTAGELFVDLDVTGVDLESQSWTNEGTMDDFIQIGFPEIVMRGRVPALSFNEGARTGDAFQAAEETPLGLVGLDATRTVEAWVWNADIAGEETILSWGGRGGPAGTNMSFNYGTNPDFGAIGHWDFPDIGWGTVPVAGAWHHLVYTFDGTTTRVYVDGAETNSEELGLGVINTNTVAFITVAAQTEMDGVTLNLPLEGELDIARIRIHDEALEACEVQSNFLLERGDFLSQPCPEEGDENFADTRCEGLELFVEDGAAGLINVTATASASDDTGDLIWYTFRASNGVDDGMVVGPQTSNVVVWTGLDAAADWQFSVEVDDDLDCPDVAEDALCVSDLGGGGREVFVRGDTDGSGSINLTDGLAILLFNFQGGAAPSCMDAADTDDSGSLNLTDAIIIFQWLFLGGNAPVAPAPSTANYVGADCGEDPTSGDAFGCANPGPVCAPAQ